MASLRGKWSIDGKAANARDIAAAMALARQHMKKRSDAARESRALDSVAKSVAAHMRRAAREMEQGSGRWISVRPKSEGGRSRGRVRDRGLELMAGLLVRKNASSRGSDGLSSFHFSWRGRGLRPRKGQSNNSSYRRGEAVRLVRYIMRELAREIEDGGIVSSISNDPDEIAAVFGAVEELEITGGRDNASVYISMVVSLPHELTPEGRERALTDICQAFDEEKLPYAAVLHRPDPGTDDRNFHAHIIASLRPFKKERDGSYSFTALASADLNDEVFITPLRERMATAFNTQMENLEARTGKPSRRFTHLSNKDRGLTPKTKGEGKDGPGRKATDRKARDLENAQSEIRLLHEREQVLDRIVELAEMVSELPVIDTAAVIAEAKAKMVSISQRPAIGAVIDVTSSAPPALPSPEVTRAVEAKPVTAPSSTISTQDQAVSRPPPSGKAGAELPTNRGSKFSKRPAIKEVIGAMNGLTYIPMRHSSVGDWSLLSIADHPAFADDRVVLDRISAVEGDPAIQAALRSRFKAMRAQLERELTIGRDPARQSDDDPIAAIADPKLAAAARTIRDDANMIALFLRVDQYWSKRNRMGGLKTAPAHRGLDDSTTSTPDVEVRPHSKGPSDSSSEEDEYEAFRRVRTAAQKKTGRQQ